MITKETNGGINQQELSFCPLCGKEITKGSNENVGIEGKCAFCEKIINDIWNVNEKQITMSRLCSHCGNKTSVKAIFCLKCGSKINSCSLLHTPPNDREYLLGGKFGRNFSLLSIISLVLFIIALFPLLMAFVHDRFWLVFIGFFPYNLYTIMITIIGAFLGYFSRDTSSGKIGLVINCLYLLVSIIYLIYNIWVFMANPLY